MIDKEKAIDLRRDGLTYQQIAQIMGCSVQWCKTNLKDVPKNTKELSLLEKCIIMAKRPEGMSTLDLRYRIIQDYPELNTEDGLTEDGLKLYKKLKIKIRENGGTLIRPAWLKPDNVDSIFKAVIQAVDNLDRRVDEEIQDVLAIISPPEKDRQYVYKSLENQIFNLTHIGRYFSKKDVGTVIAALEETVIELRKRVPQVDPIRHTTEQFELDHETEEKIL